MNQAANLGIFQRISKLSLIHISIFIWLLPLIIYTAHLLTHGHGVTVFNIYYNAGLHWRSGEPLYNGTGFGFVYFPPSAVIFAAMSVLPVWLSSYLFSLVSLLLFAFGIYRFALLVSSALPQEKSGKYFFVMTLLAAPMSYTTIMYGQMHILIMGLIMLSFYEIYKGRFWSAALLLALSLALKPTALVAYLLVFCAFPRISLKLLLITLSLFLLPFILQHPHYVGSQYLSCLQSFEASMKYDAVHTISRWATFFSALYMVTHLTVSGATQFYIRIILSVLTLGVCLLARYKLSAEQALIYIMTFSMCYLMLFNSRTEMNDYVMLVPFIGLFLVRMVSVRALKRSMLIIASIIMIGFSYDLSTMFGFVHAVQVKPAGALVFSIYLLWQCVQDMRSQERATGKATEFSSKLRARFHFGRVA